METFISALNHHRPLQTCLAGLFLCCWFLFIGWITNLTEEFIFRFPIFFPLRSPVYVKPGSILEVHFWRCVGSTKVNKNIIFPLYHFITCFEEFINFASFIINNKVWYEWCVASPCSLPVHNTNGRSYWVGLWWKLSLFTHFFFKTCYELKIGVSVRLHVQHFSWCDSYWPQHVQQQLYWYFCRFSIKFSVPKHLRLVLGLDTSQSTSARLGSDSIGAPIG